MQRLLQRTRHDDLYCSSILPFSKTFNSDYNLNRIKVSVYFSLQLFVNSWCIIFLLITWWWGWNYVCGNFRLCDIEFSKNTFRLWRRGNLTHFRSDGKKQFLKKESSVIQQDLFINRSTQWTDTAVICWCEKAEHLHLKFSSVQQNI